MAEESRHTKSSPADQNRRGKETVETGKREVTELKSLKIKNRVLELISQGSKQTEVANKLKVSQSTVSRIWNEAVSDSSKTRLDYENQILDQSIKKIKNSELITRTAWQIIGGKKTANKDKLNAMKILMHKDLDRSFDHGISKQYAVRSREWPPSIGPLGT